MAEARIKIVHLSDLHIEAPLTESGRVLRSPIGARTHRYANVLAASPAIRREIFLGDVDVVAVCATGDFVTRGDQMSMILARKLLMNRHVPDIPQRPPGMEGLSAVAPSMLDIGFFASRAAMVMGVPGNHGRYGAKSQFIKNNRLFERVFAGDFSAKPANADEPFEALPPDAYQALPTVRVLTTGANRGLAAVFYGLDSNELSGFERFWPGTSIANGRVADYAIEEIQRVDRELCRTGRIKDSFSKTFNLSQHSIVRVLALHHHPLSVTDQPYKGMSVILNGQDVREIAKAVGCDLVLFGHEHAACCKFENSDNELPVYMAAPSVSVYDNAVSTGFNVIELTKSEMFYRLYENVGGVLAVTRETTFRRSR